MARGSRTFSCLRSASAIRALDESLTDRQRDVIEKWEMSELGVWPAGPLDWDCFDDTEPMYREMISDLREVGW